MPTSTTTVTLASAATLLLLLLEPTAVAARTNNSVILPQAGDDCSQFLPDVDISAPNIATAKEVRINKGDCATHCYRHPQCHAVVWSDYEGGTCWLKASYGGGAVVKRDALTILMQCTPTYLKLNNCDMPGNDITSAQRAKPEDCFAICKVTEVCAAFTWTDYNGGTCWLKSAVAPCTSAGNKHSGAMGRGGYW